MTTFDINITTNDFEHLASRIIGVQDALQAQAAHAINLALTSVTQGTGQRHITGEQ